MTNEAISSIFQPIITDWLIPVILIGVAALGKKLARAESGWVTEDFCVGPDLCLAAVSTGLFKIFDLMRHLPIPAKAVNSFSNEVALSAFLLIVTFLLFLFVLTEHRECSGSNKVWFPRFRMAVVCNLLGFACLTGFLVLIKPL